MNSKNILYIVILFFLILLYSCNEKSGVKKNELEEENVLELYSIKNGELVDSLEEGFWTIESKNGIIKEGNFSKGLKIGAWKYEINNNSYVVNWSVYTDTIKNFSINYITEWKIRKFNDYYFTATLPKDSSDFFVFNRSLKMNLNINDFLKELILTMQLDNEQKLLGYTLTEVKLTKGVSYYISASIEYDGIEYISNSYFLEDKTYFYEFTLNTKKANSMELHRAILPGIISGLKFMNSKPTFNYENIESIKTISIEDL